jgi:cytoplasmic polyadenylation element-binding protein
MFSEINGVWPLKITYTVEYWTLTYNVSFVCAGKSPFFPGLEEQAALLEDPASHLVDGQVLPQPAPPLSSPSRSSPHSQGSETGERYSRKVFVGGLPPDIDEGMLAAWGSI